MEPTVAYLVKVEPNANNNKFYRMIAQGSVFVAEYGRIGSTNFQNTQYPIGRWDATYNGKIRKGYVDQTHLIGETVVKKKSRNEYLDISDPSVADLISRLQALARQKIADNYTISSTAVTDAMVNEAQNILNNLLTISNVGDFNKTLVELFTTLPRKMRSVNDFLATSNDDFSNIIRTEQDLLDVMRGQVQSNIVEDEEPEEDTAMTILDAFGLVLSVTTSDDVSKIKRNLGEIADKYHSSWCVQNIKTQKIFDEFVVSNGNLNTKLLWHGSRNENWWNIINTGLVLRPTNVVISGKMFGYGTYFATKARKSFGYTSYHGSYWARGNSANAFMGLYDVAYGKPYDVHSHEWWMGSLDYNTLQEKCAGAHCLHAHEGVSLRNDEIIVYKEEQTTIKYLVELK